MQAFVLEIDLIVFILIVVAPVELFPDSAPEQEDRGDNYGLHPTTVLL